MVEYVAWMVVLLLVGPPLMLLAGGFLFAAAAMLPDTPRRLRESFWCPFKARLVTADFLVPIRAAQASEVVSCSAFPGGHVRCKGACRSLTHVEWGASRGMFPRWALTADGPVSWRSPEAPPSPR
jgi:hypothetical protein